MFKQATAKLSIGSLDDPNLSIETDYNPKEVSLARTVPWSNDKHVGKDALTPEYTGSQPRSLDLELLFDGYEKNYSMQDAMWILEKLATPTDITSGTEQERRPHYCIVTWGQGERAAFPPFRCVIESVTTKVTMFAKDGAPLRIVANVKVREARMKDEVRYEAAAARQLAQAAGRADARASGQQQQDAQWRRRELENELE